MSSSVSVYRKSILTAFVFGILPGTWVEWGQCQDVAGRLEVSELVAGDPDEGRLRKELFSKIGFGRDCWLMVVRYSRVDRARCLAVRELFKEDGPPSALGIVPRKSVGKELVYCSSWSDAVQSKPTTEEEIGKLLAVAWELVEKAEVGAHEANFHRIEGFHGEMIYVYCRNPSFKVWFKLFGGVICNPVAGTKSDLFLKTVNAEMDFFEKPTK